MQPIDRQPVSRKPIKSTVLKCLQCWPGYCGHHVVTIHRFGADKVWIGYRTTRLPRMGTTYFDANVINGIFYLMHIELEPENRGKGWGALFYTAIESVARLLGCAEIHQTPSGHTPQGESRMDYLLRRGWERRGVWVRKVLNSPVEQRREGNPT